MTPKEYAIYNHQSTNHLYDGQPYEIHLTHVVSIAKEYLSLIHIIWHSTVIDACWCHDLIEDCRITYNDLKKVSTEDVANIVYAVTNEKGKNRKERASEKYYSEMKKNPYAVFVKLCDRIANIRYSLSKNSRMADAYRKENKYFQQMLYLDKFKPMFDEIDNLLNIST